jgi:Putative peptidoglycan binding domain
VPKKSARDEDAPRRRGAKAAVVDIETERNLAMRILLHSPKDTLAGLVAVAAVTAIVANALFLQTGRHPAPMFGTVINLPAPSAVSLSNPLPRPRPLAADSLPLALKPMEFRLAEPKATAAEKPPVSEKPAEATASTSSSTSKSADSLTNLVKATTTTPPSQSVVVARPPAPIPAQQSPASRRAAAVQRALSEYGYGQLKVTGSISGETQAAIQKFEREHKMPVTGQVSDRLLRELAAAIGHPVE